METTGTGARSAFPPRLPRGEPPLWLYRAAHPQRLLPPCGRRRRFRTVQFLTLAVPASTTTRRTLSLADARVSVSAFGVVLMTIAARGHAPS
jgi:hypothetical protein